MITKTEVLNKISELSQYCVANGYEGGNYAGFISQVSSAVEQYFSSFSSELVNSINVLIPNLYSDLYLRDTSYERPMGGPLPTNYPKGYSDLTQLFDGAGVFTEILNISPATFLAGFPIQTTAAGEEGGASTTEVLINPIIPVWTLLLESAHEEEISGIDAISAFCIKSSMCHSLIALFEDRGRATRTKHTPDFAYDIYIGMKVKEVIQTFNLDIHIPTYL